MEAKAEGHGLVVVVGDFGRDRQRPAVEGMFQRQQEIEGIDRACCIGCHQFMAAHGGGGRGQRKFAAAGKAVLAHREDGAIDGHGIVRRLADDGKQNRRAPAPEGGIAMPQPGAAIGRGQRLHFRAERGDFDRKVLVTDPDGAGHHISSASRGCGRA
ncbi:hypothetical protein D3C87_1710330 [compost metagenome]